MCVILEPISASRIHDTVLEWSRRVCCVNLLHMALRGQAQEQRVLAEEMQTDFGMNSSMYSCISYPDMLQKTRLIFNYIPEHTMNPALRSFLAGRLKDLTPEIVLGLRPFIFIL